MVIIYVGLEIISVKMAPSSVSCLMLNEDQCASKNSFAINQDCVEVCVRQGLRYLIKESKARDLWSTSVK